MYTEGLLPFSVMGVHDIQNVNLKDKPKKEQLAEPSRVEVTSAMEKH